MSHSEDDLQMETFVIEPLTDKILAVYKEPPLQKIMMDSVFC
jgi:hypothetical protein